MRILLDYRPALRARTGVGEYAHELATALARQLAPDDRLVLFSSSWKDRLSPGTIPGVPVIDARVPVTFLNLAWHRLEWPSIETFSGEVDVVHSMHPLLMPAQRAAQVVTIHDLYFLDAPENTSAEIRRDYPSLAGSHARRADAGHHGLGLHRATDPLEARSRRRSCHDLPQRRASVDTDRGSRQAAGGHVPRASSWAQSSLARTSAPLLRAYAGLLERRPDAPPLVLAGRLTQACQPLLDELARPPLAGRVAPSRVRRAAQSGSDSTGRRRWSCCPRSTKGSGCRPSKR